MPYTLGDTVTTPEGRGTIRTIIDAGHPMRLHNPTGWTYADGTPIPPETTLYVVTLRDNHHALYEEEELL